MIFITNKLRPRRLLWSLNPLLMLIFADISVYSFMWVPILIVPICNATKMRKCMLRWLKLQCKKLPGILRCLITSRWQSLNEHDLWVSREPTCGVILGISSHLLSLFSQEIMGLFFFLFVPLWLVGMSPFFKVKFNYGNAGSLTFLVFYWYEIVCPYPR